MSKTNDDGTKRAEKERKTRFGDSRLSQILMVAVIVAMLGTLVLLYWQRSAQTLDQSDFDGKIVDRWANYAESQQGSTPRFFLLVDAQRGRFTLRVEPTTYESAKVGMRIKRESGKIVLIDLGKTPR